MSIKENFDHNLFFNQFLFAKFPSEYVFQSVANHQTKTSWKGSKLASKSRIAEQIADSNFISEVALFLVQRFLQSHKYNKKKFALKFYFTVFLLWDFRHLFVELTFVVTEVCETIHFLNYIFILKFKSELIN